MRYLSHHCQITSLSGERSSERQYIRDEVRTLVRKNKFLTDSKEIDFKVHEFETRIETGIHYKIPYPRPVNVAPGATGKDPETVTPVYLHSYKEGTASESSPRRKANVPIYDE